ncbi:hypothetical protein [Pararhodobacter aggregans]|uniref:hypothetical protein n=1 Tax=Pararhodobacter aggregans TaxID=404875 RepID=UPI000D44FF87|nr:hypothetical protein [Pararhodobacter aggregans]PTX05230.1 hypothetical protein C8N33_101647 [Pararhodobacter aggregans]
MIHAPLLLALLLALGGPALGQPTGPGNSSGDVVLQGDMPLPPPRPRPRGPAAPGCCTGLSR